jgi:general nucleoside transport system permease protein
LAKIMLKPAYYPILAILLAIAFITLIISLAGASPIAVLTNLVSGITSRPEQMARVLVTAVPLVICTSGLLFTFASGLYNLGIEGQIVMGAIAAMLPMPLWEMGVPAPLVMILALLAGCLGGALWGLVAGLLHVYGRISEIFAGLGLNFVADGLALYLIFGPWKRPGVASMSGTELLNEALWLPTWGRTEASPIAILIAIAVLVATIVVLRGTYFGLQLRAVGQNLRAAYVLGIPSVQRRLSAFGICGLLGGLAGALQVLVVFHRLIPGVSSNLGYLALLIAMLVGMRGVWILPIGLLFSALNVGGLQLPLALNLESSLAGVIQGTLVLFILLSRGFQMRQENRRGKLV